MPSIYVKRDKRLVIPINETFGICTYYMGGKGKLWDIETKNKSILIQSKTCQERGGSIVIHERDLTVEVDWTFSRWRQEVTEKGIQEEPLTAFYVCYTDMKPLYDDASERIAKNIEANKKNPGAAYTWNQIVNMFATLDRLPIVET